LLAALAFWFGAVPLCGLFTADPAVLEEAVLYARVLAFSQLFVAWEALAEGVLEGAGDTQAVFWLSSPVNLLRVPLAWAVAGPLGLGAAGIWWVINLTTIVKALLKGARVARGRWVEVDV
jgi:MATE family multidrug resistance protein